MTPTPHDSERGASAILIALCAVILFGIAAWVIDGSALYQERAELQNGADAAALAIARDCAVDLCTGGYDADAVAQPYIDQNASDDRTDLQATGVIVDLIAQTVRVPVETFDNGDDLDGDSSTVDYVFAPVIGRDGLQVHAATVAAWGTAGGGATLPLIISECDWADATSDGTVYATGPPFDPSDNEVTITFHDPTNPAESCDAHPGHDYDGDTRLPGGFGWLQNTDCVADIEPDLWVGAKPGNGPPSGCDPASLVNTTVMIPVFDDLVVGNPSPCSGPGGKCYRILGFAAFYITGFRLGGSGQGWVQGNPVPCSPPVNCISGYFTEFVFGDATGGGGTDLGANAVWLVS